MNTSNEAAVSENSFGCLPEQSANQDDGNRHKLTPLAVLGALGIVFGDIGTSPLYAFREPLHIAMHGGVALGDAVFGVLSLIFWALTLTISIKYVLFVLQADNDGEGGDLALVTSLGLHKAKKRRAIVLLIAGLVGTSMLFGDGVITPAISVLSAVEGLSVVAPSLEHWAIHVAIAVLILVFLSQRFGTDKIGGLYGPLILVWFISLAVLGIDGIMQYPHILQSLDPRFAISLIGRHPGMASAIIGAVILAVTGGEALYVDLGHFGRKVIRTAWFFIAMPALLINYMGQGALVMMNPDLVDNPFYQLAPDWFGLPLLILATLATVVASQAVITGAFSVARQTIEIGYFPPMRTYVTSENNLSHTYIARLNYILMLLTLLVIVVFRSSGALASAYGIAVAVAMTMTTLLFSAWMLKKSGWPKWIVFGLSAGFLCLDLSFLLGNLSKVPDGGWLPLMMGAGILFMMLSWRRGVEKISGRHSGHIETIEDFSARIVGAPLAQVHKVGIFFSRTGTMAPVPLEMLTNTLHVRFQTVLILSIRIESRPRVPQAERIQIIRSSDDLIKVELNYGYMQTINVPSTIGPVLMHLGIETDDTLYVIGHERIIPPQRLRNFTDVMSLVFSFLGTTAERAVDRFMLPPSRTLEIGYPVQF